MSEPSEDAGTSEDQEEDGREASTTLALFEGDEGRLTLPERSAIVTLLKHRFVTARSHSKAWAVLRTNPRGIRSVLNDLFLEVVIDRDAEVAYKRQVVPEAGDRFPTLLHDLPWGREETIVLVFARTRHRHEKAAGAERVFVERDDILEYVAAHRPNSATDKAGDLKRAQRAIENIVKTGILAGRISDARFEISPAIEPMLPMAKLRELLEWLRGQNSATPDDASDAAAAEQAAAAPGPVYLGIAELDEDDTDPLAGLTRADQPPGELPQDQLMLDDLTLDVAGLEARSADHDRPRPAVQPENLRHEHAETNPTATEETW